MSWLQVLAARQIARIKIAIKKDDCAIRDDMISVSEFMFVGRTLRSSASKSSAAVHSEAKSIIENVTFSR